MALNPKQRRFIDQYLVDLNATQAAMRAGYSTETAHSQGSRLLKNVEIAAEIESARSRQSARTEITQDRVLTEIARLAFLDVRKLFDSGGRPKAIGELDDDTAAAISGIDVAQTKGERGRVGTVVTTTKYRLADKRGALELLARHLGMLNDKMKLQGDADSPLTILRRQIMDNAKVFHPVGDGS
jgi:phage terminase small subunit